MAIQVHIYGLPEVLTEAYGAPGVYVRPFHPSRRFEFTVPVPGTVPTAWVSNEEWCDVQDAITEADVNVSSDLFVTSTGDDLCNHWDPRGRRWVVLRQSDSGVRQSRVPKPKPWMPVYTTTGWGE